MGHPGETHTVPVGHRDGMGSWHQGLWVGWCGTSRGDPYHPSGTPGWDGQLGPRPWPLGGMVWDIPGRPVPSRWDTGTGWAAGTKATGLDGTSRGDPYPDQGLWVGWCGPYHPGMGLAYFSSVGLLRNPMVPMDSPWQCWTSLSLVHRRPSLEGSMSVILHVLQLSN